MKLTTLYATQLRVLWEWRGGWWALIKRLRRHPRSSPRSRCG